MNFHVDGKKGPEMRQSEGFPLLVLHHEHLQCVTAAERDGEIECGKWKSQVLADPCCVVIVRLQMEDRNNASIRERSLRLAEGWAFDIFRVSFVLFEVGEGLKSFWED